VRVWGSIGGYRYFNHLGRIKYLGSALFTKWLYFAYKQEDREDTHDVPILDDTVRNWMATHADIKAELDDLGDYTRFELLLDDWGKQHRRTSAQVEEAIFNLAAESEG